MTFEATYLGSNGWLIKFKKTNLIIDPWLKGDLIFPPGEWFFKGSLEEEISIDKKIDIILLTQGLPDHCHVPTLEMFRKDIPIICPKSAVETLEKIGFSSIKMLKPTEKTIKFNLSWYYPEKIRTMTITGEFGIIFWDEENQFVRLTKNIWSGERFNYSPNTQNYFANTNPLRNELSEFVASVMEKRKPMTDVDHAIDVAKNLDLLAESFA